MKPKSTLRSYLALAGSSLLAISYAHAATFYWDTNGNAITPAAATGTWGTNNFWSTAAAGNNATSAQTIDNTSDLFFSADTDSTGGVVTVLNTQSAHSITFDDTTGGITLSGGTAINLGSAVAGSGLFFTSATGSANIISTGIILNSAATAIAITNSTASLQTIGAITGSAAGLQTVTVGATSSGGILLNGIIDNGLGGGTVGLTVNSSGAGVTTLTGANGYTGSTIINRGTLDLGGSTATGSLASTVLTLGGGTLSYTRTGNTTQAFTTTNITAGASTITAVAGNTLTLGALSRPGFGTVNFGNTGTITTSTANNATGILGGWATYDGNTWAVANGAGTAISGLANGSYTTTTGLAANAYAGHIDVDSINATPDPAITVHSLRFSEGAANILTLAGANTITTGGILVGSTVLANLSTITGGTLTGIANGDLSIIQNNTAAGLTISSSIVDTTSTSVTKSGAGLLTLSNSNTYSGGTTVNLGTLTTGNATALGSISGQLTVNTGGTLSMGSQSITVGNLTGTGGVINGTSGTRTLTIGQGDTGGGNFQGIIANGSGTTALTKTGTGTITLSANNTYTGITTIDAGTLQLGTGGATGALSSSTIVNNGSLFYNYTAINQTPGVISGTGSVTYTGGGGSMTLNTLNNYAGGFTLNSGSVINISAVNYGGFGTGTVTATGGSFGFGGSSSATINNNLNWGGSIVLFGAGPPTPTWNGTLTLSSNLTLSLGLVGGTTYNSPTFAGNISGAYGITVNSGGGNSGPNVITLSGANNTFSGGLTLNTAASKVMVLNINSDTALGATAGTFTINSNNLVTIDNNSAAAITLANNNPLAINGNFIFKGTRDLNMGTGAVNLGAAVRSITTTAGIFTLGGVISSGGITKAGAGTLVLSGANNYASATSVSLGTIIARSASALGTTSTANVSITAGASATGLNYVAATDTALNIDGTLTINGGANTFIGGSIGASATSARINVAGNALVPTGASGVKVNVYGVSGASRLAGTNTYTLISGLGGGASQLDDGIYTLGTVFNNTDFTVGSITKSTTGLFIDVTKATALNVGTFYVGGLAGATNVWAASNGSTASNFATTSGGTSQVLVPGSAASVTIDNSSIATSTVLGADMSISGLTISDDTNNFALNADGYGLTIGTGGITKSNTTTKTATIASNIVLGQNQTWSNSDTGNALVVSGTVTGANNLAVGGAGNTTISGRLLTGAGTLTKTGAGTLTLSKANTYTGATTISSGTLALSGSGSLADTGAVNIDNALGVFNISAVTTGETIGSLAGVASSSVVLGSKNLTVGDATDTTYDGVISGISGSLTKTGAGTMTLTGTNTYTGATTVTGTGSKLIVNGSISTSILTTVQTGATLGGSGTVGALTIDSGGFFSPGNSPGITTANGNYIQNGSLVSEVTGLTAGSQHDQVVVNGTVTLNGLLDLTTFSGTYAANNLLFILLNDSNDAINGTFTGVADGAVVSTYGGFDWTISYFGNNTAPGVGTFTGGNDVVLKAVAAVPEPRAALLGGLGMLMLLRRRRA